MVEAQQYDYVLLKTKINSILVMAELCKRKLGSSSLLETMLLQFKITYFNEKLHVVIIKHLDQIQTLFKVLLRLDRWKWELSH